MDTTQDMLKSLLDDNINVFRASFDDSIKELINDKIIDKQLEMSKDIIKNDNKDKVVEEGYGRIGADSYKFETVEEARELVQSAVKAGVPQKGLTVKENVVNVGDLGDKDMEEILYNLAKGMGAEINESRNIINTLQEAIVGDSKTTFIFNNGGQKTISLNEARRLVLVHDNLIKENQIKLRTKLEESPETFNRMVEFSKKASIRIDNN